MRLHKKRRTPAALLAPALVLALVLIFSALPVFASAEGARRLCFENGKSVSIRTEGGEDFVSLYASALALGGSGKFEGTSLTMNVKIGSHSVFARRGAAYITSDGKKIP